MVRDIISVQELGRKIFQEKKMIGELGSLLSHRGQKTSPEETRMVNSQTDAIINSIKNLGQEIVDSLGEIILATPLNGEDSREANSPDKMNKNFQSLPTSPIPQMSSQLPSPNLYTGRTTLPVHKLNSEEEKRNSKLDDIEKLTIKRSKKKEEKVKEEKERKPSSYMKVSGKMFYNFSKSLVDKGVFENLKRELVKANVEVVPTAYVSAMFFSTLLAVGIGIILALFFLFFNLGFTWPIITLVEGGILPRLLKVMWIPIILPIVTFLFGYAYPYMERKTLEAKINHELPFATIHMSAISSSMIEPSKLFGIIVSTKEYPRIEKELIKLQNEINIYGYDLVTALRNRAFNSPSRKLSELFNGLATTITSGGNLPVFFDKRSQTLLFEYRLDVEKEGKAAETFMDIYISVVIASPMVLMLLLMMMRISGLGIALSPTMITVVIVAAVCLINIVFLAFLHLRNPER